MLRCFLAFLLLAATAFQAGANEDLFATKIRRPGVDLAVQELIRTRTTSTVRSLQRIPRSQSGQAALVHALRDLARERGARYFRMEKPYAVTVAGELRIVHFYSYPAVLSLRRIYSAKGPSRW